MLGEKIEFLRTQRGIKHDTLAEYLNVTEGAVIEWESGRANPDLILIPMIAKFFGTSIDALFDYITDVSDCIQEDIDTVKRSSSVSDSIGSIIDMWECLRIKYPHDYRIEKELVMELCKKNDITLYDKIFYHMINLLRKNRNLEINDEALRVFKAFLHGMLNPCKTRDESFVLVSSDNIKTEQNPMMKLVKDMERRQLAELDHLAAGILNQEDINYLLKILKTPKEPIKGILSANENTKLPNLLSQNEIDSLFSVRNKHNALKPDGKNALIIDDIPVIRRMIREILEREGYCIIGEACNGLEGFALALDLQPDVVLMDIGMPVMDGLESTAKIIKYLPNLPVLIVSALCNSSSVNNALKIGAFDFVCKPFESERIIEAMNKLYG